MGDLVTLRPVTEDDLSWLASLRSSPVAAGLHAWHGWSDPERRRRQWAESGLLGDDGGTLIVLHDTDRVGDVSWRKVKTGPTAFSWAIGIGLAPEFRGRGYGSEAQRLLARYLPFFAYTHHALCVITCAVLHRTRRFLENEALKQPPNWSLSPV
jgi:RimJ/RimL family protein N-acetyltransferase